MYRAFNYALMADQGVLNRVDEIGWHLLEDPDIDEMEKVFFGIYINKRFQRHSARRNGDLAAIGSRSAAGLPSLRF